MLDAISEFVHAGFALHWLHPRTKRPIGDDWSIKPVASLEQLERSYKKGNNLGVRLGQPSKISGLYLHVIDLDIRKSEAVDEAHENLEALFPDSGEWPCVISGSGGESRHFYFLTDGHFGSKKLAHSKEFYMEFDEAKGRDVKHWFWEIELFGTGKQVVMPPSIHPDTGEPYRWLREFDMGMVELGVGPIMASAQMPTAAKADREDDDTDDLLSLVRTPPLGLTEQEIRDIVFALPMEEWCEDREGWLNVGMSIHHETEGSDEGFDIWCDFAERSTKYDAKNQRQVWKSFHNDGGGATRTMGSLRKILREEGADFMQCKAKLELATKYRQAIMEAAQYQLSATEIDTILPRLVVLAEAEGRTANKPSIKKDLIEARKSTAEKVEARRQKSLEDWLADEVLRLFWKGGDHLRRMGKLYWVYDKGVWRVLDAELIDNRVYRLLAKVIKSDNGEGSALQSLLDESGRVDMMNALVNSVVGLIAKKSAHDSREDPLGLCRRHVDSVMNCRNGEIWFSKGVGRMKEHNPEHLLTAQITAEYDKDATCPEWDAALLRIFRDHPDTEDVIRHLHEVMGYIIQGQRELAAWIMFYGQGSNGKSFVASILQTIMGSKSWVGKSLAEFGRNGNNHMEAGLVGKLMLIDDDYDKNTMLPDGALKKLSEAKALTANPKNANEFNFVCRTTPILLANHWPKTRDMSFGLERRALVFHFNSTISREETDMGLERRVAENELSGVLNHLIAGWKRLQGRGHFLEPSSCWAAKTVWLGKRNTLASFASECLEVTGDLDDELPALDVWTAFQFWTTADNSGAKWGRNTFYDEIASIPGITRILKQRANWFKGVKLLQVETPFDHLDDDGDDDLDGLI